MWTSSEILIFTEKTYRSKNSPTCKNDVARTHGSWMLQVMGSCGNAALNTCKVECHLSDPKAINHWRKTLTLKLSIIFRCSYWTNTTPCLGQGSGGVVTRYVFASLIPFLNPNCWSLIPKARQILALIPKNGLAWSLKKLWSRSHGLSLVPDPAKLWPLIPFLWFWPHIPCYEQVLAITVTRYNRPFPSCLVPPFHYDSKCKTFHMKMSKIFICMNLCVKLIFIWKVSHLDWFWNGGKGNSEMAY